MSLIKEIDPLLTKYLEPYFSTLYDYGITSTDHLIEISGKKREKDAGSFILLRLGINETNKEIYLYNIFLPIEDRRRGIGLALIAFIYEISKAANFALVLADMTDGFRNAMLRRGALTTTAYDCLQVVDTTDLQ